MLKIPGKIIGDKLVKGVKRAKHYMKFVRGYAWSKEQISRAKAAGVKVLELQEDTGRVLRITLDNVLEHGTNFQFGGFEPQIGIAESKMTEINTKQGELFK